MLKRVVRRAVKRAASSVGSFLIILLALTVQADDVLITNKYDYPVQFRVLIRSTGFDKTVTLQPGEIQNAIGTDLWHNAYVVITGINSDPSGKDYCVLTIEEKNINPQRLIPDFYLPKVTSDPSFRACPYTTDLPADCDCFDPHSAGRCYIACKVLKNAQVTVAH